MLFEKSVIPFFLPIGITVAAPTSNSGGWGWPSWQPGSGSPWHWPGPNDQGGYWFDQFESVLSTMQGTYWNGTYWPTTIQWIGAFLDTLLSASEISFTNALEEYNGNVPGAHTSAASIQAEINEYFGQIDAYYGGEDTYAES